MGHVIVRHTDPVGPGLEVITEEAKQPEFPLDFGILRLGHGEGFESQPGTERAILLMRGTVRFHWRSDSRESRRECGRSNELDGEPYVLHIPATDSARIESTDGTAELVIQGRRNTNAFEPRLWEPGDYRSERFGEGSMQDTATRTVRTVFDTSTAPQSSMVIGEVVNHPGKWSSYPPHSHAHPEIYYYRFFPGQGYGHAECGDEVYKVRDRDTYIIPPEVAHSQCAAPGYAMYYVWGIPHLPGNRFGPDSRIFDPQHRWLSSADAPIWPDRPLSEIEEPLVERDNEIE